MRDSCAEGNSSGFHRVLYTKHLVKRKKTYHDGFLQVANGQSAWLLSELGQKLATGRLPSNCFPLSADLEGTFCYLSFLEFLSSCLP